MTAAVEASFKAREVESWLDIYLYRPIGYQFARFFARLGFTPSMVSLLGAMVGIAAGHFYLYPDLRLNLCGMALHVLTNALDNADGQLARITNRGSLQGAIVDGCADYIVFASVYVHLGLRLAGETGSSSVWILTAAAALSHVVQSMMADYFRNGYLQFVAGKRSLDLNSSEHVAQEYRRADWSTFWRKLGLWNYVNYTRRQEMIAPSLLRLHAVTSGGTDNGFREEYRARCLPLVKYNNGLATNPRMIFLFGTLLLGHPAWYFWWEVTVLNLLLFYVLSRHQAAFRALAQKAKSVRAQSAF